MNRRVRLLVWIVLGAMGFGIFVVSARLWAGESWFQVVVTILFLVLWNAGDAWLRRRRKRRASSASHC